MTLQENSRSIKSTHRIDGTGVAVLHFNPVLVTSGDYFDLKGLFANATSRRKLVDGNVARCYQCISRCVRSAHLLGEIGTDAVDRKAWIENRLQELDKIFAVSVGGFSVLDNHLHLLVRLDSAEAAAWTDEEVVCRWFRLYPPRGADRKPLASAQVDERVQQRLKDEKWVAAARERLGSLGWFMKCLKEPLSRLVNKSDKCTGSFFEGRYKSIAILDEEALLSVCAYIDLNPVAAGLPWPLSRVSILR